MGHSEYRKRNKRWDEKEYKDNRMLNYMVMRHLLGRKKSFYNPFIDEDGTVKLNRSKLDKIVNKRSSYVSEIDANTWSVKMNMDIGIFLGEQRFKLPNSIKYPLVTEMEWTKFTEYMYRINLEAPNFINNEMRDTYDAINAFRAEIKKYLKDILNTDISRIKDEQLKRFVFYIKNGTKYLDDTTFQRCSELVDTMKNFTIHDLSKLNDDNLVDYKNELMRQLEKVNAIIICRKDGVLVKK